MIIESLNATVFRAILSSKMAGTAPLDLGNLFSARGLVALVTGGGTGNVDVVGLWAGIKYSWSV